MYTKEAIRNFGDLMDTIFEGNVGKRNFKDDMERNYSIQPPVNIFEMEHQFFIEVLAPGVKKEDIKLQVEDNILTLSYDKNEPAKVETGKLLRGEFTVKSFKRSFTLNDAIQTEGILASYEEGILKIEIPKKEPVKPVQIEINVK
ncbi:MAG TPA: Hsp20/alpha crystallin family protein [Edaphocola sp.]|nr:Hsp20/alpha crystallin family protein [Edaphocola sp.]